MNKTLIKAVIKHTSAYINELKSVKYFKITFRVAKYREKYCHDNWDFISYSP